MVMASNMRGRPISSKYLRPTSRPPETPPTDSSTSQEVSTTLRREESGE